MLNKILKILIKPNETDPKIAVPERVWIIITKDLGNDRFEGKIDNDPMTIKSIKADDIVMFHKDDILDVYDKSRGMGRVLEKQEIPFEQRVQFDYHCFQHRIHPDYEKLLKIYVDPDEQWENDYLKEELLVEQVGLRQYKIICIPVCIDRLCYEDVITFLPDNFYEYTIQPSDFICLKLYEEDKDFSFIDPFRQWLVFEQLTQDRVAIAFDKKYETQLQGLFVILNDPIKHNYFSKGVEKLD